MRIHQTLILLLFYIFLVTPFGSCAQPSSRLSFKAGNGLSVIVEKGVIFVNKKQLYKLQSDDIDYGSKRNRVIEDGGSFFLLLQISDEPDPDKLYVFQLFGTSVVLLAEAISSELKDFDGDSYLEFGGCNQTEMHSSKDSMYYIPFSYYEIRNGKILFDSAFSKKKDIEVNGVYLSDFRDVNGGCCKVIVKPRLNSVRLVDPLIVSERIDGPANIRDTIKGQTLFVLNDNIAVSTSDPSNGWYRAGLEIDLTEEQYTTAKILKGERLFVNGREVGKVLNDINLFDSYKVKGNAKGFLMGFTAVQNIREATMPEVILANMIKTNSAENIGIARLKDFLKGFGFIKTTMGSFATYQLDEGVVWEPSSPMRLMLVFNKDGLFSVVHRRLLPDELTSKVLHSGYLLTVIDSPGQGYTDKFIMEFNKWVDAAN